MIKEITLYSLSKTSKPLEWTIKWDTDSNWYTMASGFVGGAITETKPTECFGKNTGKANETTNISQCELEVLARIEKQRKKGFENIIPTTKRFEVTLAKEFNARKKYIKCPQYVSAKLDGFRCYITKDGMFSRTHHKIESCPHIFEEIQFLFLAEPSLILDGELYSHELKDDFNQVASLISRTKNFTPEFLESTKNIIKFHIFDTVDHKNTYRFRTKPFNLVSPHNVDPIFLEPQNIFIKKPVEVDDPNKHGIVQIKLNYVVKVIQYMVVNFTEIEILLNKALDVGFEGIMLRTPSAPYINGRSSDLIKYKKFQDSEYKVIDIKDGLGNHSGQASIIVCENDKGTTFSCGTGKGWNETAKRDLFINKDKFIGKMATIVYQDLTPDENIPRFGKLKAFRE